jgi:hypothetical protein
MKITKLQVEEGYIAASTLIIILGVIVILSFVIEVGRMLNVSAQVENGVDLASSAGVYKYSQVLQKKTKEEYDIAYALSKIEVEAEIGETGLPPNEMELLIKAKTKEKMILKVGIIKSESRNSCEEKIKEIVLSNKLIYVSGSCTDSEVKVRAKQTYSPVFSGGIHLAGSIMERDSSKKIIIETL